jgi:hypothetical protein
MTSSEKTETMHTLVRQWKDSGLSQAKFAAQHNLTLVKFRYWIKKLKEPSDIEPVFVQIKGFSAQSISLHYPNGIELVLPIQTPVHILNSLIHHPAGCSR